MSQIAVLGDQPNDVLMFRKSGLSIAMGNASDEVKEQADAVTTPFTEEGFANAVENLILPLTKPAGGAGGKENGDVMTTAISPMQDLKEQQLRKIKTEPGFIAALD